MGIILNRLTDPWIKGKIPDLSSKTKATLERLFFQIIGPDGDSTPGHTCKNVRSGYNRLKKQFYRLGYVMSVS